MTSTSSSRSLLDLAEQVVDRAGPGEEVEAYAASEVETSVKVRDAAIEELKSAATRGVGVRVIKDGRQGYAYTSVVTEDGLEEALAEARSNAAVAMPDDANGLPRKSRVKALDGLVDEHFDAVSIDEKIDLARELEAATLRADGRVRGVETAAYEDVRTEVALASTAGHALHEARTDAYAYAFVMAGNDDETHTALGLTLGRGARELDVEAAGTEAAVKAARLLGARKPASRKTAIVLDPYVTAQFLGVLSSALSAEAVMKQRSLFAGRLGEEVAASNVSLVDDGLLPGGPATGAWDAEGVPQQRTALIDGGRLASYLHNTWTARRMDAESTGNASRASFKSSPGLAPTNLFLEGGILPVEDLLRQVETGVYVQDVMGLHSGANPISGEFSVSFTGLEISDGELGQPIREAAVSSTIVDILQDIRAVADDRRFFPFGGSLGGATVLVGQMSVSGS